MYLAVRRELREKGIDASDLEARLLVSSAAGKTSEQFMRDRHLYVADDDYEKAVRALVERRVQGEPIAYILGEWEFYGLPMTVTPDVLIPRVDTEVLADVVIERCKKRQEAMRVLDLCAGTGCVGLAVAMNAPLSRVLLAEKSPEALHICRQNMIRNNMTRRVMNIELDVLDTPPVLLGGFDIVLSNPPYIPTGDLDKLDGSVRNFEPMIALDGGEDGLVFYRSIASKWRTVLKNGGLLALECGVGQAPAVSAILRKNGFTDIGTYKDTRQIERVVTGTKAN